MKESKETCKRKVNQSEQDNISFNDINICVDIILF